MGLSGEKTYNKDQLRKENEIAFRKKNHCCLNHYLLCMFPDFVLRTSHRN